MGIQCHFELINVLPKMKSIEILRYSHEEGDGPNQDEPFDSYACVILFPDSRKVLAHTSMNSEGSISNLWFDANHWGSNRHQVDTLKDNLIPFIES